MTTRTYTVSHIEAAFHFPEEATDFETDSGGAKANFSKSALNLTDENAKLIIVSDDGCTHALDTDTIAEDPIMSNVVRVEIRNSAGQVVPVQGLPIEDPMVVQLRLNTGKLQETGGNMREKIACKWRDEETMEWKTSGCETDVSVFDTTGR